MYQVRVTLKDTRPAVWRRILVPADITLGPMHEMLQAAMGWRGGHGHQFRVAGKRFGEPKADPGEGPDGTVADESLLTLSQATLGGIQAIDYEYDPGDVWLHTLRVEKVTSSRETPGSFPLCTAGAGACPPEDVGGASGYESFLWALAHPNHLDHDRYVEWVGGKFDPERFDLAAADRRIRSVRY